VSAVRARGFTLLEVLVALAVLAIALGAATAAVSRYVDHQGYLQERTLGTLVAHDVLAEFRLRKDWPATGEETGELDMARHHWYWRAVVAGTQDPDLRRVDIEIRAGDRDGPVLARLSGFLEKPAPRPADLPPAGQDRVTT